MRRIASAWSLAIVGLAALGVAEPASRESGELTGEQPDAPSSLAAFRGTASTQALQLVSASDGGKEEETTAPPDEVTTTPVPEETPSGVLLGIKHACAKQLFRSHHQWINALLAFIFGIVMLYDSDHFFKWLVIAAAFLLSAVVAMSEVSDLWALDEGSKIRHFVGLEVGALGAYAAWLGLEGVMIVIGAILGCCAAFAAQGKLVALGVSSLSTNKLVIVLLYSLITAGSVVIFKRKKHVKGLAVLSAVVGGALVSSAMSWFMTDLAVLGYLNALGSAFRGLTPAGGAWIEFFLFLWSSSASDRGWFVDSSHNFEISGQTYRLDRVVGCSLWLLLSVIGAVVQLRALKSRVAEARGPRAESLQEALLPAEK